MTLEDLEKKIVKYKENKKILDNLTKLFMCTITGVHVRQNESLLPIYFNTSQFQLKSQTEIRNLIVSDLQEYKTQLQKEIAEFEVLLLAIDKIVIL